MSTDKYRGSIEFVPDSHFNIFHHCKFSYNRDNEKIEYNNDPDGEEDEYVNISNFTVSESGFSFQKGNNKRLKKYLDETPLEKQLSKELYYLVNNFRYIDEYYYTGIDGIWTSTKVLSFGFSSWKNYDCGDFLSFKRSGDKLYTGHPPLYDKIEVFNIKFAINKIDLETSKGEIHYEYNLNPHLHNFVKFYFMEGFSEFIKNK